MLIFCDFIQVFVCTTNHHLNNILRTNPTTLVLSSLVSEFFTVTKSEKKMLLFCFGVGGTETKTVCQTVK